MPPSRKKSFGVQQLVGALASTMRGAKRTYGSRSRSRGRSSTRTPSRARASSTAKASKRPRLRTRSRSTRSATSTVTNTSRRSEEAGQHNELSSSYISVFNGKVPKRYKGIVKGALQHQFGSQYKQTATASQWIVTIGNLVTLSQMTTASGINGVASADSWPCNPYDLNPYQGTTAGALLSAQATPANDRCYFHSITGEIDLTGLENIAQQVDLYLVKYKITTNDTLPTIWSNVLDATSVGLGQPAAVQGTTAANAVYGRPVNSTYGQNWESHPTMRKSFKILAKRTCTLTTGSTHKFKYNVKYNRMMDKEYFLESAAGDEFIKGYTMSWVMRIKAAPVWQSDTSKMTPGPVDVGIMHTYTLKVSYPMEKRLYGYRTDAGFIQSTTVLNDKIFLDTDVASNVVQL